LGGGFETDYLTREQADRIPEDRKKASMALEEEEMEGDLKTSCADAKTKRSLVKALALRNKEWFGMIM
jgi:hypothetical protein